MNSKGFKCKSPNVTGFLISLQCLASKALYPFHFVHRQGFKCSQAHVAIPVLLRDGLTFCNFKGEKRGLKLNNNKQLASSLITNMLNLMHIRHASPQLQKNGYSTFNHHNITEYHRGFWGFGLF